MLNGLIVYPVEVLNDAVANVNPFVVLDLLDHIREPAQIFFIVCIDDKVYLIQIASMRDQILS